MKTISYLHVISGRVITVKWVMNKVLVFKVSWSLKLWIKDGEPFSCFHLPFHIFIQIFLNFLLTFEKFLEGWKVWFYTLKKSGYCIYIYKYVSFFFFFCFLVCTCGIWKFPGKESNQSYSCWPMPQPQQCQIRAVLLACASF